MSRRLQLVAAFLLVVVVLCVLVLTEDTRLDHALVIELFRV